MTVTIADRAGKCFHVHAHAQGYARWKSGSVSIEQESPRSVVAKVRGEPTREVRLEEDGERLLVECTCPARTFERPGCKHVWAALLEIDHRGALAGLRSTRAALRVDFLERPKAAASPPAQGATTKKENKRGKTVTAAKHVKKQRSKPRVRSSHA